MLFEGIRQLLGEAFRVSADRALEDMAITSDAIRSLYKQSGISIDYGSYKKR